MYFNPSLTIGLIDKEFELPTISYVLGLVLHLRLEGYVNHTLLQYLVNQSYSEKLPDCGFHNIHILLCILCTSFVILRLLILIN